MLPFEVPSMFICSRSSELVAIVGAAVFPQRSQVANLAQTRWIFRSNNVKLLIWQDTRTSDASEVFYGMPVERTWLGTAFHK